MDILLAFQRRSRKSLDRWMNRLRTFFDKRVLYRFDQSNERAKVVQNLDFKNATS